jgi:hypothetical protein
MARSNFHQLWDAAILLTTVLFILCRFDWKSAEVNKGMLYNLGDALGIRWAPERPHIPIFGHTVRILSHGILFFVIIMFILVDLGLLLYFIFDC